MKFTYEKEIINLRSNEYHLTIDFYHYQESYNSSETIFLKNLDEKVLEQLILKLKEFENSEEEHFSFDYINNSDTADYIDFSCPIDYFCDGTWYCSAKLNKIIFLDESGIIYKVGIEENY